MKKIKVLGLILGLSVFFTACSGSVSGGNGEGGGGDNGSYNLKTTEPSTRDKELNIVGVIDNIQIDQEYDTSAYKGKKAFLVVTNNSDVKKTVYKDGNPSSSVNSTKARNAASSNDIQTNKGKYVNIPFNPPEVRRPVEPDSASNTNKFNKNEYLNKNVRAVIGDRNDFYAYDSNGDISTTLAKNAVLKAIGQHCNVWYVSKSGISVNDSALKTLAETFDKIFEYETYIFGSNVPTKTYNNVIIPVTKETKIDIIVYDLFGDYLETKKNGYGTFGYFTALDLWVEDPDMKTTGSNQSETLHIDSYFLQVAPKMVQSTIAHEFQHLLHYINKCINQELEEYERPDGQTGYTFRNTETWFTEMMSMVCEDIMQDVIGLKDEESSKGRLPQFNYNYQLGFTTWRDKDPNDPSAVLYSYANAYTFAAYLIRNFGFDFIRDLATNSYTKGREAITEALKNCSNDADVKSFEAALDKYYNVVLNPKGTEYTLNKKAEKTYTDVGGDKTVTFKCTPINLFEYITISANYMNNQNYYLERWYGSEENTNYCGPYILNNWYYWNLEPTGMSVTYVGEIIEDKYTLPSSAFNKDDDLNYKVVFVE